MKPNLWIYSSEEKINETAISLILFGAKIFNDTKIIKELDLLESLNDRLDNETLELPNDELHEFMFEWLVDCVKILIFFENYMKAELMANGFCVHKLNNEIPEFKKLAKKQGREPIPISLINSIEPFEVYIETEQVFHRAIKEITIGINEMVSSDNYFKYYKFSIDDLSFLKEIIRYRNKLHFNDSISFAISSEKIKRIKSIKLFVENLIENVLQIRDN